MRVVYSIVYLLLILSLTGCCVFAGKSDRPTRNAVAFLEAALIPPVLGNLLIVGTDLRITALIGCYLYYLGMDVVMLALVNFTNIYCKGTGDGRMKPTVMYVLLMIDTAQMILNPLTGHAFAITAAEVEGAPYYKMIPYWGQTFHRVVDYLVFFCVLLIFVIAAVKTPKISRERYTVLLMTMIAVGLWLSYNIFFRIPIDRSMIGFGIFGLMIFYFAIRYRPLRLLDRVLSYIVSDQSDSFYVFDPNGNCIWANAEGCRLVGITGENYDVITWKLFSLFGIKANAVEHLAKRKVGEGEDARFFLLEENQVRDSKGRLDGTYLRIQDVTENEQMIQKRDEQIGQISQVAYQDALTGVGNKNAYTRQVNTLNAQIAAGGEMHFAVLMVDMNNLKYINDTFGHKAGDQYIKGCCRIICEIFKDVPVYRVGGDEFVLIVQGSAFEKRHADTEALREAFAESYADAEKDPWLRYSAAVGIAENASDDSTFELVFKRADEAMYEDKKRFKKKYGSYR